MLSPYLPSLHPSHQQVWGNTLVARALEGYPIHGLVSLQVMEAIAEHGSP
jgi:hypothetical protein